MEIQEIIKVQKKDIKVFENSELASKERRMLRNKLNGKIRVLFLEDVAYFVVADIIRLLGTSSNSSGLLYKVDPENKKMVFSELLATAGTQGVWCVNSKALTQILNKPSIANKLGAKKAIQWITNEVIPSVNIAVNENIAYKQNNKRDFAVLQKINSKAIIIAEIDEVDGYLLDDYNLVGHVTDCKLDKLELEKGFVAVKDDEINAMRKDLSKIAKLSQKWFERTT